MIPHVSAENVTIDNSMSIQDTVNSVNDDDTIFLSPGTYIESGIKIDKNITLQGMGSADEVIIDGNKTNSIIVVNSISTVKIFNVTFINGHGPEFGGAIHSELGGQIYVDSCNFINNTAGHNGGAIDIAGEQHRIKWETFTNYGFLNATNCNFINNRADHDGGAIATYWGNSYVYNSFFTQNYAERDGGAIGVGVYSTTLTENCTFDNNTAKEWGGALYNWPGELTVNNCTISNNYAGTQGGAMITSGPLTVTNSKIINNTGVKKGGVVFIAEETPKIPSTVIFKDNYIEGNTAKVGSLVYVDETTSTETDFNGNSWDINPESDEWAKAFTTNGLINMPTKFIDNAGNIVTMIPKEAPEETTPHVPEERPDHNPGIIDPEDIPKKPDTENKTPEVETNTTIPENTETNATTPEEIETNTTIPENVETNTTTPEEIETNTTIPENTETNTDIIEEIKNIPEQIQEAVEETIENINVQSNSTITENTEVGADSAINSQTSEEPAATENSAADDGKTSKAHEINKKDVAKQSTSPIPYIIAVLIVLAFLVYGYSKHYKNDD